MEGVLRSTIDVDCSTPFLSLKGENTAYFMRKCRLQDRPYRRAILEDGAGRLRGSRNEMLSPGKGIPWAWHEQRTGSRNPQPDIMFFLYIPRPPRGLRNFFIRHISICFPMRIQKDTIFTTAALESEKSGLQEEMNVVAELIQQCINENARVALDQAEYQARYSALADRFDKAKERLEAVSMETTEKQARREMVEQCLAELAKQEGVVTEFDEDLWYALVDYVTVFNKKDIRFSFKDGTEIKV